MTYFKTKNKIYWKSKVSSLNSWAWQGKPRLPGCPGMAVPERHWLNFVEKGKNRAGRAWSWNYPLPTWASLHDLFVLELLMPLLTLWKPSTTMEGNGISASPPPFSFCLCLVCGPGAMLMLSCHFGLVSQITVINANSQHELWAAQMLDNPRAGREPSFYIS